MAGNSEANQWSTKLRHALREIPAVEQVLRRWDDHASRQSPVVAIVGPYDAGKSALIKRLLVEEGRPVPSWLTVTGRPETFETNEVAVAGCLVRDVPGMGGGNEDHEQRAADALLAADVIVQVLLPQLVTGRRESLAELWTGRMFHPSGWRYPQQALQVVIGRIDEIVDPEENPTGFQERLGAKRRELVALMGHEGLERDEASIFCIAADPYGEVGNRQDLCAEDYAVGRSWDGIERLHACFKRLSDDFATLRVSAEDRFTVGVASLAVRALTETQRVESERLAQAQNDQKRRNSALERVGAIEDTARQSLDHAVEEAVTSVSHAGAPGDGLVGRMKERLEEDLARWRDRVANECDKVADDLVIQFQAQRDRPSVRPFENISGEDVSGTDRGTTAAEVNRYVSVTKQVYAAALAGVEALHGDSFAKARAEIDSGGAGALKRLFRGKDGAWLRNLAKVDKVLEGTGPLLTELSSLLIDELHDRKLADQREKRRAVLRGEVEQAARRMAQTFFEGDPACGSLGVAGDFKEFRAAICAAFPSDLEVGGLEAEVRRLASQVGRLQELLGDARAAKAGSATAGARA